MYAVNAFHRFKERIKYQLNARSRHGVHSPFVYRFIEKALHGRKDKTLKEAILHYFRDYDTKFDDWDLRTGCTENTLIILKDIHQNKKNTEHWKALISNPKVRLSIDVYEYGLLFFKKDFLERQHFVVKT